MTEPLTLRDLDAIGVERIKGVGEKKLASLHAVGIDTVLDLLTTYPRRWVDRTNEARVSDLLPGQEALVLVSVRSVSKRAMRNRRTMVNVVVGDGSGRLQVVFFNQPWREKQLREGIQVALFGKAEVYRGGLQMTNPVVDLIGDRTGRIVAVYPQSEKAALMTWEIAGWVEDALRKCSPRGIADPVSDATRRRYGLIARGAAFHSIHSPDTIAEKEQARRRLAFDELLRVQTMLVMRKRMLERESKAIRHTVAGELTARLYAALPYELTGAQRRVIAEMENDLAGPHPMHRLLQGDVGSGKTLVAVSAMLTAVQGGHQGALMAPTEVLAEQHVTGVRQMLEGVTVPDAANLFGDRPLRVEVLTNRVTGGERRDVMAGLADGTVDIAIGTHALIQEGVRFHSLGVVVVDEQHRFRRRATCGPALQGRRRCRTRRAGDDGHSDPADRGHDGLRRSRRQRPRRDATRSHPDRDPLGGWSVDGAGGVGNRPRRSGCRTAGLRGVSIDRREREARGRQRTGDVRSARRR